MKKKKAVDYTEDLLTSSTGSRGITLNMRMLTVQLHALNNKKEKIH